MPDRPILHAIIARKLANGDMGRSRVVTLGVAYLAMKSGQYWVLGPDPEDEDRLAAWEREQALINKPRWQK